MISSVESCFDVALEPSLQPPSAIVDVNDVSAIPHPARRSIDAHPYHPCFQHTKNITGTFQADQNMLQKSGLPLTKKSEAIVHSLLAVSAVSLAWNMIAGGRAPETEAVHKVLLAGYRHYDQASRKMRELISQPDTMEREALVVSTFVLVPFATASQQIHHWISSRRGKGKPLDILSSTPRDVITMLRGLRTMLETAEPRYTDRRQLLTKQDLNTRSISVQRLTSPIVLISSRTKIIATMIETSCEDAFSALKRRLHSLNLCESDPCVVAFDALEQISHSAFSMAKLSEASSKSTPVAEYLRIQAIQFPLIASLLQCFLGQSSEIKYTFPQSESLTHLILCFYAQVPQEYLDLVLPLLDQRLNRPGSTGSDDFTVDLTRKQALALDIYAHWSVLMFLVQDESWWIGTLPMVTLEGMLNTYGDQFVSRLWPGNAFEAAVWWPGSMLKMLQGLE